MLVQRGTVTLTGASNTATLGTAVDSSKAFIIVEIRDATNTAPDDFLVAGYFTTEGASVTGLTFERGATGGSVTVRWQVIEHDLLTVEHGLKNCADADEDATITAVTLAETFPVISYKATGSLHNSSGEYDQTFIAAAITSTTNIKFITDNADGGTLNIDVRYQIVSWQGASVQRKTLSFGATELTKTASITAVVLARSFIIATSTIGPASDVGQRIGNYKFNSTTEIQGQRGTHVNEAQTAEVYVIELAATANVQNFAIADVGQPTAQAITAVGDTAETFTLAKAYRTAGTGGGFDRVFITTELSSTTNVNVHVGDASGTQPAELFVVELPDEVTSMNVSDDVAVDDFAGIPGELIIVRETVTVQVVAGGFTHEVDVFDAVTVAENISVVLVSLVNVNDAITVAENITALLTSFVNVNDAVSVAEDISVILVSLINVNEEITVTDVPTVEPPLVQINVFDAITVAEDITPLVTSFIDVNEAITVAEDVNVALAHTINVNDAITVAENIKVLLTSFVNVNDAITVAENISVILVSLVDVFDAITVTEDVTVDVPLLIDVFDAVSVAEAVTMDLEVKVNVFDAITVAENISVILVSLVDVSDAITVTESVNATLAYNVNVFDAITVAEAVTVDVPVNINVFEAVTVAEQVTMLVTSFVDVFEAVTVNENINVTLVSLVNVSDTVTVAEQVTVDVPIEISVFDAVTVAESITVFHDAPALINVSETITVTEQVIPDVPVNIDVFEAITVSEFIDVIRDATRDIDVSDDVNVVEFLGVSVEAGPTDTYIVYGETGSHLSVFVDGLEVARFKDDGDLDVNGNINENAF